MFIEKKKTETLLTDFWAVIYKTSEFNLVKKQTLHYFNFRQ